MASRDEFRRRLEDLNRGPLPKSTEGEADVEALRRKLSKSRAARAKPAGRTPGAPTAGRALPDAIRYRRDLPPPRPPAPRRRPVGEPVDLAAAVDGAEVEAPHGGRAFLIASDVRELEEAGGLCEGFHAALTRAGSSARRWLAAMGEPRAFRPEDVLFLDLETTGLTGTPLFLIGTMVWEDGGLVVRQYFARTYAEERAVLSLFFDRAATKKLLVSFNGKTFDLPYVRVRAAANALACAEPPGHLDLLHVSRRIWRGRLPDCKLQTLERHVCGRMRFGDLPGAEIPRAYHDYVRTGDAREMVDCLRHNLLDLVTLADLMTRLPPPG